MSAYQMLKDTSMTVRKARQKQNALTCSTILGEMETVSKRSGKEITDKIVYGKIRKAIEINHDNFKLVRTDEARDKITAENKFLNGLLPQELSEDEIRKILVELNPGHVGDAMQHMNANYTGRFNGGIASKIARELTSK